MIDKLSLENFRCFNKLMIKPGKINIFVGRNNTGKSSIFYSLLLISNKLNLINKIERSQLLNSLIKFGNNSSKIEININKDNISMELFSKDHENFKKEYKNILQEIIKSIGITKLNSEYIEELLNNVLLVKYKFNRKSKTTILFNSYNYMKTLYEYAGDSIYILETGKIKKVYDINNIEYYNFYENYKKLDLETLLKISKVMQNLKILDKNMIFSKDNNEIFLINTKKFEKIPFHIRGYGFKKLTVLFSLISKKNRIILIEEPENNLHPGYLIKFVKILIDLYKEYNLQFFFTTHSREFIEYIIEYLSIIPEAQKDFKLFQLSKEDQNIFCKELNYEEAQNMIENLYLDPREL